MGIAKNLWSVGDKVGIQLNGTVGSLAINGKYYAFILAFGGCGLLILLALATSAVSLRTAMRAITLLAIRLAWLLALWSAAMRHKSVVLCTILPRAAIRLKK